MDRKGKTRQRLFCAASKAWYGILSTVVARRSSLPADGVDIIASPYEDGPCGLCLNTHYERLQAGCYGLCAISWCSVRDQAVIIMWKVEAYRFNMNVFVPFAVLLFIRWRYIPWSMCHTKVSDWLLVCGCCLIRKSGRWLIVTCRLSHTDWERFVTERQFSMQGRNIDKLKNNMI